MEATLREGASREGNEANEERISRRAAEGREADIWEPLLVLADLAGGEWPELARAAAVMLSAASDEQDFTSRLLGDIQAIFGAYEADKLFSRQLVEALTRMVERPWRELRRGGPINESWLARQLSAFGIQAGRRQAAPESDRGGRKSIV